MKGKRERGAQKVAILGMGLAAAGVARQVISRLMGDAGFDVIGSPKELAMPMLSPEDAIKLSEAEQKRERRRQRNLQRDGHA